MRGTPNPGMTSLCCFSIAAHGVYPSGHFVDKTGARAAANPIDGDKKFMTVSCAFT
ncbi:hypothetical protein BDI4_510053 [Burkholderia diffusa]|nr:hypothetical protein BDI4_510053 [Burkholderia diffusa]